MWRRYFTFGPFWVASMIGLVILASNVPMDTWQLVAAGFVAGGAVAALDMLCGFRF